MNDHTCAIAVRAVSAENHDVWVVPSKNTTVVDPVLSKAGVPSKIKEPHQNGTPPIKNQAGVICAGFHVAGFSVEIVDL